MARIPLAVGQRGLDTGSVVQYPSGSPVGAAMSGFGDALQGVAEHVKQKKERHDGFVASTIENEFTSVLPALEDEAIQNAPADASGLHDSVYGEIDPVTHTAVKPGSFDALFDSYLERVPESKRQEFAAKREVYRLRGSTRLAQAQYQGEQRYYNVEIQKTQNQITTAMAMADPNDEETFESFKRQGLDIIEKSGLPALEKDVAKTNWLANADETLFKTKLAKDPAFAANARAALGLAPPPQKMELPADTGSRMNHAMSYFVGRGYTKEQAAGIVGNLLAESKLNTGARNPSDGRDGSDSVGIAQWNGDRARALKRFAAQNRADWRDFNVQLAFVEHELATSESGAGAALKGARTVEEAAAAMAGYERPAGWSAQNPRGAHNFSGRVAFAQQAAGLEVTGAGPDPAFANIPLERRLVLANQADVQVAETQRTAVATAKAEYTSYKDALELQIVQGQVRDEALISGDGILNDGDKATLIRSMRTQNETANQIQADLVALNDRSLVLDPYGSKDKTRADNLYADAAKRLPEEQHGVIAGAILEQTGIVPQPVVNGIRRGLSSTNVPEVVAAAQTAQRIATFDPAALARREGGSEAQKAADDFSFYVNKLNLSPEEAARRLIEKNAPEKQFQRKALEPAAKEFLKAVESEDLASSFDGDWIPFNDPALGFTPAQEMGIKAEFLAIAEDQFYATNGDPDLARNRAVEEMKRLYGVTEIGGARTVIKHPPERYWPAMPDASDPYGYVKDQIFDAYKDMISDQDVKTAFAGRSGGGKLDIPALKKDMLLNSMIIVTTPQTDAMVKRGELPAYSVLFKDSNGAYQTLPGKLFQPDVSAIKGAQDAAVERARETQDEMRFRAEQANSPDGGREQALDDFLAGPPLPPDGTFQPVETPGKETLGTRIEDRRDQLFDNARERGIVPGAK